MRVDFNVPLNSNGVITDDTRIVASLPSIRAILDRGGKPILMSHLGRPKGKIVPALSLAPLARRLEELLGVVVHLAPDCVGNEVEQLTRDLPGGEILLLENLRFHKGETKPELEPGFAEGLARLGDVYVNDAFGTAHRAHASTALIIKYFPGVAASGLLLEKEIQYLGQTLTRPRRPFMAISGGAKVSTKIEVLEAVIPKINALFIGGGMAYTFLKGAGYAVGNSLVEDDLIPATVRIRDACREYDVPLYLPVDIVVAPEISEEAPTRIIRVEEGIPLGHEGLDIGPETIAQWKGVLENAQTILWNGPVGVFELANFAHGTYALARLLATLRAVTIVGGGDLAAAVRAAGVADKMTHICTGGGAALEYIRYGHLPGIDALTKA